ncbi:hypothetical protein AB0I28_31755 [Phytomonospora sp. NPDC050363]|uniref:hypothetical protein n=1 Tax=Phytomonospora sp. NPDC050363 TaxID=3155642 RepID=UPI0033D82410
MSRLHALLDPIRRPWSKPTLVLVTALIAGAAGYSVSATRPPEKPPVVEHPMVVESWIGELEREPEAEALGEIAEEALAARPPGVDVIRELVVAQNPYSSSSGGLVALPAGEWEIYVSCRFGEQAEDTEGLRAGVSLYGNGGGTDRYAEVDCPVDGGKVLMVLKTTADTAYVVTAMAVSPGDMTEDDFWQTEMAVGVFVVAA